MFCSSVFNNGLVRVNINFYNRLALNSAIKSLDTFSISYALNHAAPANKSVTSNSKIAPYKNVIWCGLLGTQVPKVESDACPAHTVILLAVFCRWGRWRCWFLRIRDDDHRQSIRNRLTINIRNRKEEETQHKKDKDETLHGDWKQVWSWFDASAP